MWKTTKKSLRAEVYAIVCFSSLYEKKYLNRLCTIASCFSLNKKNNSNKFDEFRTWSDSKKVSLVEIQRWKDKSGMWVEWTRDATETG